MSVNVLKFSSVTSTNDLASTLVSTVNAKEWTAIIAEKQTKGRGQRGTNWHDEAGKNVLMSLMPSSFTWSIDRKFALTMAVALGVKNALDGFGVETRLKWPNDLYVGRKKIGGILMETSMSGSQIKSAILGIGINVNQDLFPFEAVNATSLKLELNRELDVSHVCSRIIDEVQSRWTTLMERGVAEIKRDYLKSLLGLHERLSFEVNQEVVYGWIQGVGPDGRLEVEIDHRMQRFDLKEIKFLL